ncbi:MAG TPA: rhodanese-like domain-containing protein [Kiritimatiellia bacterium]|nr:rhodanese-like domain-containing protein [Kiritimatiellia bacterium]
MNSSVWMIALAVLAVFILLKQLGQARAGVVKQLRAEGGRVIDVRTASEFAAGHLPDAINVPLGELSERIASVAPDKTQPLLLHCASGARSAAAAKILKDLGYTRAVNAGSYSRARALLNAPDR